MKTLYFAKLPVCIALIAAAGFGQTKLSFEVATIKPSQPLDPAKMLATMQGGGKLPVGANIDGSRAEYLYLDLKSLMTYAYGVKPYQITGPDWMATTRFDIQAKMPDGSKKDDASKMLQTLLEDRFHLTVHKATGEHPVLALVVGKNGPKLKTSNEKLAPIDESAPLKQGEMKMDGPDGPVRAKIDLTTGSSVIDMGLKGKMAYKLNPATQSLHVDFTGTTMTGLADMMTQLMTQLGGAAGSGKQIVDMTGIQGNYDASMEISLVELIAMIRNLGANIPNLPGGGPGGGAAGGPNAIATASDPGGSGTSVTDAIQAMGLKLENRKASVEQLIVDHIDKTPTDN
jgi:uncharacterized protein (TIGR03435 family)